VADREAAILTAALAEFGRSGYADASVDDIARAAGVAKPTVYNRFGDKRSLFIRAWTTGALRSRDRVQRAIESADPRPDDLERTLVALGHALVECVTDEEGSAILRLQAGERSRFPELDETSERSRASNLDQLAGKLAQYSARGLLRLPDPGRAASHFMALVTDGALRQRVRHPPSDELRTRRVGARRSRDLPRRVRLHLSVQSTGGPGIGCASARLPRRPR